LVDGFKKVSELKLAVAKKIRDFTLGGGFLFAMCSATDTYDIAMAADGIDICESIFDGDPADHDTNAKLDFSNFLEAGAVKWADISGGANDTTFLADLGALKVQLSQFRDSVSSFII
jgi:hypothetical protein